MCCSIRFDVLELDFGTAQAAQLLHGGGLQIVHGPEHATTARTLPAEELGPGLDLAKQSTPAPLFGRRLHQVVAVASVEELIGIRLQLVDHLGNVGLDLGELLLERLHQEVGMCRGGKVAISCDGCGLGHRLAPVGPSGWRLSDVYTLYHVYTSVNNKTVN
jgi:hypothetical protein